MIVITGASDGLGAALLDVAISRGYEVVNISRRENKNATVNILADLSTNEGIAQAVKELAKLKRISTVIFNAGVFSYGAIEDVTESEYDRTMDINTKSPALMTAALATRIRNEEIDLVYINSIAGQQTYKNQIIYNMSKWALRGLTDNVRRELEDTDCRVTGIYPDMIDTGIAQKLPTPLPKSKHRTLPPRELAEQIISAIEAPKHMVVNDMIIERKK